MSIYTNKNSNKKIESEIEAKIRSNKIQKIKKLLPFKYSAISAVLKDYDYSFSDLEINPKDYSNISPRLKHIFNLYQIPFFVSDYVLKSPKSFETDFQKRWNAFLEADHPEHIKRFIRSNYTTKTVRADCRIAICSIINANNYENNCSVFSDICVEQLTDSFRKQFVYYFATWESGKFQPILTKIPNTVVSNDPFKWSINKWIVNPIFTSRDNLVDITEQFTDKQLVRYYKNVYYHVSKRMDSKITTAEQEYLTKEFKWISLNDFAEIVYYDRTMDSLLKQRIIRKGLENKQSVLTDIREDMIIGYAQALENMRNPYSVSFYYNNKFDRHVSQYSMLSRESRYILDRVNNLTQNDIESCHHNIIVSLLLGSTKPEVIEDIYYHEVSCNNKQQRDNKVHYNNIIFLNNEIDDFQKNSLIDLSGKFRQNLQKTGHFDDIPEEAFKKTLLENINIENKLMFIGNYRAVNKAIQEIPGGNFYIKFIMEQKVNDHKNISKIMFGIESMMMETISARCNKLGIKTLMIHDCVSYKTEYKETVDQIMKDYFLEIGFLQESTKEIIRKQISLVDQKII